MKHLFLEGPIQTGKSTLIREALKPYMASEPYLSCGQPVESVIGGFASQRLVSGDTTCAFRIGPAASTPLTAPVSDVFPSSVTLDGLSAEELVSQGVFKALCGPENGGTFVDDSVFDTLGASYLKDTEGRRLMLLDEIGGHELCCRDFMDALYDLLAGDIPCVGVIKHPDSLRRMDASLIDLYCDLRSRITSEFDGRILYYERGDENVRRLLDAFLVGALIL